MPPSKNIGSFKILTKLLVSISGLTKNNNGVTLPFIDFFPLLIAAAQH
jgi:hypothetical protein